MRRTLACAGVLLIAAGQVAAAAAADSVETAALTPGTTEADGLVHLPELLTLEDETRYRAIFGLQEAGQWRAADREIKQLNDRRLVGHVLAQRYLHPTKYRSKYHELRDWLAEYADHPDALRIYRLALRRKPADAKAPRKPQGNNFTAIAEKNASTAKAYKSKKQRSRAQRKRVREIEAAIRARIRRGWPTGANRLLGQKEAQSLLDSVEIDRARASIASAYFYYGKDRDALALADAATDRSGPFVPLAHWAGGLAAWRLGLFDKAGGHFEALALAERVSVWDRTAGAYWAARVHLVNRRPDQVSRWLEIAADYPRTFYGLLARRALGLPTSFDWNAPPLAEDDIDLLLRHSACQRAIALIQVDRKLRAERELRRVRPDGPEMAHALIAVALQYSLPRLAMGVAAAVEDWNGLTYDAADFPIPDWLPEEGYSIDRALIFAFIRQESQFNAFAKSRAGARGVMQLMPRTASFIGRNRNLRGSGRYRLFEPEFNISLGQKYLTHLAEHEQIERDLFNLTAAYNGGPGNLAKWQRHTDYGEDPLLFIESLPARETRDFIERVLTNLWIYRDRLNQAKPSLDAIAAGEWPIYTSLDDRATALSKNDPD